jgi:lipoprotein-anchoring transpeptidase ErfK/SrfK
VLVGVSAGALLLVFALPSSPDASPRSDPGAERRFFAAGTAGTLRAPPRPGFVVPAPERLDDTGVSLWAPVLRAARARSRPAPDASLVARLPTRTPEGTANIVLVLERQARAGRLWVRVRLPVLPNKRTGWVERTALGGYVTVRTRLVIDRSRLQATLLQAGRPIFRAAIGVGTARWPTPTGSFYIRNRLTKYESPFYGPVAFGTSARSPILTDWPAGGFVGIHGTDRPDLLPGRVSHGCVRMRNDDIVRLAELMPVGTPVTIRR